MKADTIQTWRPNVLRSTSTILSEGCNWSTPILQGCLCLWQCKAWCAYSRTHGLQLRKTWHDNDIMKCRKACDSYYQNCPVRGCPIIFAVQIYSDWKPVLSCCQESCVLSWAWRKSPSSMWIWQCALDDHVWRPSACVSSSIRQRTCISEIVALISS